MSERPINVVVAGLTRSGLTLTCQMLSAGGMKVAGSFPGFEPYPIGCVPWGDINGQVVKLVDSHNHLPPEGTFAVIRLKRNLQEQAKSFVKFAGHFTSAKPPKGRDLVKSFKRDYKIIDEWAGNQRSSITIDFEQAISNPKSVVSRLAEFLGVDLDVDAAVSSVIPRDAGCHDDLLELKML